MANAIKVDTGKLRSTKADIVGELTPKYKQLYENMYKKMGDMRSSAWQGLDIDAYLTRIEEFRKEFDKMKGHLDAYGDYLQKSAEAYEATQSDIKSKAEHLTVGT